MATETTPENTPFVYKEADLSPLEEQRAFLQDTMLGIGSFATKHNIPILTALDDPFYTGQVARNLTFASEFIPGFGDVQGAREGEHMMKHGQPKLGAAMVGLSALPFVPITPIKKALERGLKASPTKVMRTNTGDQAVSDAYYSPEEGNYLSQDTVNYDALREGRLNYETNAERQLLSNPAFPDPAKAYNVDEFINSTVSNSPKEIRTTVRNQLDEWVSPDLRGSKATTQELLDDIGTNKPTIQENYMNDTSYDEYRGVGSGSSYSEFMPNIPTTNPYPNPLTALETVNPDRYTERSFSIHSPNQGKLFNDPGHTEVSVGNQLRDTYDINNTSGDYSNSANRIFTTRAGVYDIDGVQTYVAAEGQSGVYGMGTSRRKALEAANPGTTGLSPDVIDSMLPRFDKEGYKSISEGAAPMDDIIKYLDDPYEIDVVNHAEMTVDVGVPQGLPTSEDFLKTLERNGNTLDDWNAVVKEYRDYIAEQVNHVEKLTPLIPADQMQTLFQSTASVNERQVAVSLATDDANAKYIPKLSQMVRVQQLDQPVPNTPPLHKEWFPLHMKTSINDAVEVGAEKIRFPINDYSVAKQTGQPIVPARAQQFRDEYTPELEASTEINTPSRYTDVFSPSKEPEALGPMYEQRTLEGIKRIEAEYGIKLNPTETVDDNKNRFLEITLTPEISEALQTIVFNRGGAVYKKPLMNLKY